MQEELALPTALKRAPVTRRYEPLCCYVFHPSFWPPGLKPGAPLGYWGALPPRRADHAASQYPNGVGTQGANDERMGIQMSTNVFETVPVRTRYGAVETNGVADMQALLATIKGTVYWNDPQLKRVFRLRLLTDRGFPMYDVSYCYGTLKDGTNVRVSLPFHQLTKRKWKSEIIEWAKRDGVFAKRLGILDDDVMSTVR